jgi:pimeloyl-ACP methyl ester carboxylesterase
LGCALAAGRPDAEVAFLVLIASAGVSPAAQMRHGTAQQLRRAGFGPCEVAELLSVRSVYEAALRGTGDVDEAQRQLDKIADRPWRHLAWLPDRVPEVGAWKDMDFDPQPVFAATHCPVLTIWGEDDPSLPVDDSETVWRAAVGSRLSVLWLPGTGRGPDPRDHLYEDALLAHIAGAL